MSRKTKGKSNFFYIILEIEKLLNDIGKSLKDYSTMPFPHDIFTSSDLNRLIFEEKSYDKTEMKKKYDANYGKLNVEQKNFNVVIDSIEQGKGGLFFEKAHSLHTTT